MKIGGINAPLFYLATAVCWVVIIMSYAVIVWAVVEMVTFSLGGYK